MERPPEALLIEEDIRGRYDNGLMIEYEDDKLVSERLGLSVEEFRDFFSFIQYTLPADRPLLLAIVRGLRDNPGTPRQLRFRLRLGRDHIRFLSLHAIHISGEPDWTYFRIRDHTEHQRQLLETARRARLEGVGLTVSTLRHYVENPLSVALGYSASLARNKRIPRVFTDAAKEVLDSNKTIAGVVRRLRKLLSQSGDVELIPQNPTIINLDNIKDDEDDSTSGHT